MSTQHSSPAGNQAKPPLLLSRVDCARLEALLESQADHEVPGLRAELERAEVVDPGDVPGDVIAMNSTARFRDEASGEEREMSLVYPRDTDGSPGKVSILAPVGSALLGLRVGHVIEWPVPGGRTIRLRVLSVSNPPEAGDQRR